MSVMKNNLVKAKLILTKLFKLIKESPKMLAITFFKKTLIAFAAKLKLSL
jgi:hypothetical protein